MKEIDASSSGQIKIDKIYEEIEDFLVEDDTKSDDAFYTLEELNEMDDESYPFMARNFTNLRFKRNQPFKSRPKSKPFNNKEKAPKIFSE